MKPNFFSRYFSQIQEDLFVCFFLDEIRAQNLAWGSAESIQTITNLSSNLLFKTQPSNLNFYPDGSYIKMRLLLGYTFGQNRNSVFDLIVFL